MLLLWQCTSIVIRFFQLIVMALSTYLSSLIKDLELVTQKILNSYISHYAVCWYFSIFFSGRTRRVVGSNRKVVFFDQNGKEECSFVYNDRKMNHNSVSQPYRKMRCYWQFWFFLFVFLIKVICIHLSTSRNQTRRYNNENILSFRVK